MKIKHKVEMNLPQLIEWAWENDAMNKSFESEGGAIVYFDYDGNLTCAIGIVPQDFFTVEVEEEITEDTKLDYMYLIASNTDYSEGYYNYSINDVLSNNEGYYKELAILIIDPEPAIIWTRDKGLV